MACDVSAIDAAAFAGGPAATDAACHHLAQTIFQSLAARLFALPSEAAPVGRIAHLPAPATVLPREKPIPKPRPPTKWEVFAQVRRGATPRCRAGLPGCWTCSAVGNLQTKTDAPCLRRAAAVADRAALHDCPPTGCAALHDRPPARSARALRSGSAASWSGTRPAASGSGGTATSGPMTRRRCPSSRRGQTSRCGPAPAAVARLRGLTAAA